MDIMEEFYKDEPALALQTEGFVGKQGVKRLLQWFNKKLEAYTAKTSKVEVDDAVVDFYQYGILILDVMKLKFFSNEDDFDTVKDILLNNDKRLIYFKKKNGFWIQSEVYQR